MKRLPRQIVLFAAAAGLVAAGVSCSPRTRLARHLENGDRYFGAELYDRAEIEYKNALQLENLNPHALSQLALLYCEQGRMGPVYPMLAKARELQPDNLAVRMKLGLFCLGVGMVREAREEATFVFERAPADPQAPIVLAETALRPEDIEATRQRFEKLPPPLIETAPVQVALGILEVRAQHPDRALACFTRAQQLDPQSSRASLALGNLQLALGRRDEAARTLAHAAALAPPRSLQRIRYAQLCLQRGENERAKYILTAITRRAPDYLPAWLQLADIAANEKRYDDSIAAVERVLARDPGHLEAQLLHSRVLFTQGEHGKAVEELERTARSFPQAPQVHYQLGAAYAATGDSPKAGASLQRTLALAPNFPGAVLLLAEVNVRQTNFAPAIAALNKLIQQHPELPQARLLLAQAYRGQGRLDDALRVYQQLDAAFQRQPEAPLLAGVVLLQQNQRAEARKQFNRALDYQPGYAPAVEQLVNLDLADRNYAAALARAQTFVTQHPDSAGAHLLLAKVCAAKPDLAQAETALRKAVELQPESPVGYFLLARLYLRTRQQDKALDELQLALAKDPKNREALMLSAAIYEQKKNYTAAREHYERLLAIAPQFSAALNNLAYLYSERFGELEKAYALAQKARELRPDEPHTGDTLGWVLYHKRQFTWAATLLAESVEKLPDLPDVQYHFGMVRYAMGDEVAARTALERALASGADFSGVEEARRALAILEIDPTQAGPNERALLEKCAADRRDPMALARLGVVREKAGDRDGAFAAYEAAWQANPESVIATQTMVRLLVARKEPTKALELAKALRKLAPADPAVAHLLGRLAYDTGDHPWAASLLREAADKQPHDADLLLDFARAAYSVGQVADAETAARDSLALAPACARADEARMFIELLALAAAPARAAEETARLETLARDRPADPAVLMALAAACEHRRDYAAATKLYETVASTFPSFPAASRNLVLIYARSPGSEQRVAELANKVRIAYPDDAAVARALGIVAYRQGNYSRALTLLREASRQFPDDADLLFHLGMTQHQLKDRTASVRTLEHALQSGLDGTPAIEARRLTRATEQPR